MTDKEIRKKRKINNRMKRKLALIFVVIVLALVGLSVRIVYINETNGEKYTKKVLQQQKDDGTILPYRRGDIYDRNGTILATSEKVYRLVLDIKVLRESEDLKEGCIEATTTALTECFELTESKADLIAMCKNDANAKKAYVPLKEELTKAEISEFQKRMEEKDSKIKGVWFEEGYKRKYPYDTLACNVIGYTVSGDVGQYGIEEYYSSTLNGTNGRSYKYLNESLESETVIHEAVNGYSVMSTIDVTLQGIVEDAIDGFMERYANASYEGDGAKTAACILMDPRNGEILAMASNRKYDLNHPFDLVGTGVYTEEELAAIEAEISAVEQETAEITGNPEATKEEKDAAIAKREAVMAKKYDPLNALWRNFCVSDTYEPGSTVKPMTIAAALEAGSINETEGYYCDGSQVAVPGQKPIHCAKRIGHKMITLEGALMFSCNDALMQIASKIGYEDFVKYQRLFNFGLRTGIDLPGESRTDTVVYYMEEEAPYANLAIGPAELATCSFGQGFNTSMIQVASAFSSCINGGYYYQPHVVKKIVDGNGGTVEEMEGNLLRTTVSEQTSAKIKQYLYNTMYGEKDANGNSATGKKARIAGYAMGGKTGTAQKIPRGNGKYLVSFIGYAPYDEPQVVCYVVVDEPNAGYQASSSFAQEIWKEVMQKSLPYLNIYETEEPPEDMIDEYNATHENKVDETEGGSDEEETSEKNDEPVIDPQTGEVVTPPDLSDYENIDQETGMLKDLTQDDDYPSDILINVQPSVDETE